MKTLPLILIAAFLFQLNSNAQPFSWTKSVGGTGDENVSSIRIDSEGHFIACGNCSGNCLFGTIQFNDSSAFLVRYDSTGNANWVIHAGDYSAGPTFLPFLYTNLEINDEDQIYLIGAFTDTAIVGNVTLTSNEPENIFLAKIDINGYVFWARKIADHADGTDIALDENNNIIVTGSMRDTAHFDNVTFMNYGPPLWSDIFVAKYDSSGALVWARQAGGADFDVAYSASCDASGNIYIGGEINGDANFDAVTLTVPTHSGFVAKYNSSGAVQWAKYSGYCSFAVAADSSGNCYSGGYANGEQFDTISLPGPGAAGFFAAKLNSSGDYQWARGSSATIFSSAVTELKIDESGNCYATGHFKDSLLLDNILFVQPGAAANTHAAFIIEFSPAGQAIAGKRPMNADPSDAFGTAIDVRNCNIAFAGVYRDTPPAIYFDNDTLLSNGLHDLFISRISSCLLTSTFDKAVIPANGCFVYPNPGTGPFTISFPNIIRDGSIDVYAITGENIFHTILKGTIEKEIDPGDIAPGIYIIKVHDGDQEFRARMLVE